MDSSVLPEGWAAVTLEAVAEVHDNLREPVNSTERKSRVGPFPYYGATGQVGWIDDFRQDGEYILLGEDGAPFFDPTKDKAYLVSGKCWVNNHAHVLKGREGVCLNRYLLYALNQVNYRGFANGTTRLKLTQAAMRQLPIKLAPLAEQHRIVAKIEELFSELDQGVASLKTAREQLKVYRQSLLKHAFEGKLTAQWRMAQLANGNLGVVDEVLNQIEPIPRPNRWKTRSRDTIVGHSALAVGLPETVLPEGWRWIPMVDIARMESGHTPSRNHPEWWGGDIPWVSIPDARKKHGGIINDTAQRTNSLGLENSAARLLPARTVCVSRTASVGYVVELGTPMATSQDFVNWIPSKAVLPEWLRLVFGADREALLKFAKGTTHQTIYFPEWLSVHIALPTIAEQQKIIQEVQSKLSEADQLDQTLATELQQADALRQSILKKAFHGQLVKQAKNEEPATALLKRIRAERCANQPARRGRSAGSHS